MDQEQSFSHISPLLLFEELKQVQRIDLRVLFEDLTMSEFFVLRVIDRCFKTDSNQICVSKIVGQTDVSAQAISKILGALERKGCIVRTLNPADHRSVSVSLTPHGQEVYSVSLHHLEHYLEAVTKRMGRNNLEDLMKQMHHFHSACLDELNLEQAKAFSEKAREGLS